jgi:hypothetical protein
MTSRPPTHGATVTYATPLLSATPHGEDNPPATVSCTLALEECLQHGLWMDENRARRPENPVAAAPIHHVAEHLCEAPRGGEQLAVHSRLTYTFG